MTTTNTAITEKKEPQGIKALLNSDAYKEQFQLALPKHLSSERFIRICNTALTRNPKLLECTPSSFMKCLLDLSAMGLEPDGKKAHLIPYRDNRNNITECTLIVDYKGKVELVRRDPSVVDVQCIAIRENDEAEWVNGVMTHRIDPKASRGEVCSTYTRIVWKTGEVSVGEPFSRDDAERAKRSSKSAATGPWRDHYDEMWKKSNIHRDAKMWPLSPEIQEAISREDSHFLAELRDVTPKRKGVSEGNPTKLENPYQVADETAFADLKGAIPDESPAPDGEPPMESPVEVSEQAERAQIIDLIRETCAECEVSFQTFEGRAKKLGALPAGEAFATAGIESMRGVCDNRLAIAKGAYKAGGGA